MSIVGDLDLDTLEISDPPRYAAIAAIANELDKAAQPFWTTTKVADIAMRALPVELAVCAHLRDQAIRRHAMNAFADAYLTLAEGGTLDDAWKAAGWVNA